MIGEKKKIELAARLVGSPDRRLQNRQWAKTDAMTSVFVHYRDILKRNDGINEIEFLPKHGIYACFGKNSALAKFIYEKD